MAVLIRAAAAAAVALAGCYDPSVRDCSVRCGGAGDCAGGQVCGEDGWCAAPELAGTCRAAGDAGPDAEAPDGPPPDATSDAAGAALHVVISGRGRIVAGALGSCDSTPGTPGDCAFETTAGAVIELVPVMTNPQSAFVEWTTANCAAAPAACTVTVEAPVTLVGARFQ